MYLSKTSTLTIGVVILMLFSGFTTTNLSTSTTEQGPEVMTAGLFKIQGRLNAIIENFDFDFKCGVSSFQLVRVSKRSDPITVENQGGDFSEATRRLVNQAKAGDYYFFENIKAKCAGDSVTRKLGTVTVKIN